MDCANCGKEASEFDVHCRSCGVKLQRPSGEEQLEALNIDLAEQLPDIGPRTTPGEVAGNVFLAMLAIAWAIIATFIDALTLGQFSLRNQIDQATIERAIRNSRR